MRAFSAFVLGLALSVIMPRDSRADPDNYVEAARGRALATAGDCIACHTAIGGAPFAGGRMLQTPFGMIASANLTPDNATGIGGWTEDDFARAMHEGTRPDGRHLYPAFPYTYYTRVSREDVNAIYIYLRTLAPVANLVDRGTLPFPFGIRGIIRGWNALYFTPGRFVPDPRKSEEYNRGAYLVEGPGHCGACHTPMNAFGANKSNEYLQSNQIDLWTAPNITNDDRLGLGSWSVADIEAYLRTGATNSTIASGPMAEVVRGSTSLMPAADLHAIAVYLKERQSAEVSPRGALAAGDPGMQTGAAIFLDTCSACHARDGSGVDGLFPRLARNPAVVQDDPTSLLRVIIAGARGVATDPMPTAQAMPSLGWRLSDQEIADVVTYIRNSWDNAAAPVSAGEVASLRAKITAAAE